jgi:hypothetical protein
MLSYVPAAGRADPKTGRCLPIMRNQFLIEGSYLLIGGNRFLVVGIEIPVAGNCFLGTKRSILTMRSCLPARRIAIHVAENKLPR